LVLLFAMLGTYKFERVKHAAMAVELTHASTLVHDDVIDRSPLRRGLPTIGAARGPDSAILIGDYYFAKAYREAAAAGHPQVVAELADAVMQVCRGELEALADVRKYQRSLFRYEQHVDRKTGALMGAA